MSQSQIHNILNKFNPISLEEMDSVRLMNRMDTKFVFSEQDLFEMLPELADHYRVLKVEGNVTPGYRTVYYDTTELAMYEDHHRKKVDRFKVRYRKYLDSNIAFLEVKHKSKGRTDKKRIVVEDLFFLMPDEHASFVQSTGVENTDLKSVLVNQFNRITLVSKDLKERLTLDINLEFGTQEKTEKLENVVIAELKQENASRNSPFYAIIKRKQIRPNRISKYCIGMIKLLGVENIKYNRFKKKLLILNKLIRNAA